MNNRINSLRLGLASGSFLAFAALATFAAQTHAQSLGAAKSFGVLGASTVTNTGATVVAGDVGVSPGTAITGFPPGVITNGGVHAGDGPATQAHADLATAYNYYAGLPSPPANDLTGQDLGGKTLTPGVYHFDVAATSNGALTFDAQNNPDAIFVIKIGTTLITSGDSTVVLINGANVRNIYFQVGTGVTLGGGSSFKGNLLAGTAITAVGGVSVTGRLLALTEAVTLDTNSVHVVRLVTNTNDSGANSLRQALLDAEDGETILFDIPTGDVGYNAGVWTIDLTSGELVVDKDVMIDGLGANVLAVQRDPTATFRIFNVKPGHFVTIEGLTISNGLAQGDFPASAGGGIYNDHSNLRVDKCSLSGNSALSDSYGGGGIYNDGNAGSAILTLANSTLSGNSASNGYGGGISNNGTNSGSATLAVVNSTFSGNSAYQFGGGAIDNDTSDSAGAEVTITNCTLSGNSGGAGIVSFGPMAIGNTIFRADASEYNIDSGSGVTSLGYNLSNDNAGGLLTGAGDQIDTDPILGPLKNNGGTTMTHAPLSNSPALDRGKDIDGTGVGQRGGARPVIYDAAVTPPAGGDRSDIGAIELAAGVQPASVNSRKTHGSAGVFDLDLPLNGVPGVECRSGGATNDYQLVFYFTQPVTFSGVAVTSGSGTATLFGARPDVTRVKKTRRTKLANISGQNKFTIDLTGVTNIQTVTIALFDVNDGVNRGDVGIRMGMLLGDVNGNRTVNSSDISETQSQSGQVVGTLNFRDDLNANGVINSSDVSTVQSQSGTSLP